MTKVELIASVAAEAGMSKKDGRGVYIYAHSKKL